MRADAHREPSLVSAAREPRLLSKRTAARHGFTLLEMCIVLMIMALLLGAILPGMQSALDEQTVRSDARQLSLMVKTAMLKSSEENRPYVLELSETNLQLHPLQPAAAKGKTPQPATDARHADSDTDDDGFQLSWQMSASNRLLVPDPRIPGNWDLIVPSQWIFRPGELCPATRIRFTHGNADLEMSFNALTGNVEDERSFFP